MTSWLQSELELNSEWDESQFPKMFTYLFYETIFYDNTTLCDKKEMHFVGEDNLSDRASNN